jgi:hypothetical protein
MIHPKAIKIAHSPKFYEPIALSLTFNRAYQTRQELACTMGCPA